MEKSESRRMLETYMDVNGIAPEKLQRMLDEAWVTGLATYLNEGSAITAEY
jgi:hypothetical protein